MRKLLLSAVLTLASFAPASAQQTATVDSNIRLTPVSMVSVYGDSAQKGARSQVGSYGSPGYCP
jgi:hypothetical protein